MVKPFSAVAVLQGTVHAGDLPAELHRVHRCWHQPQHRCHGGLQDLQWWEEQHRDLDFLDWDLVEVWLVELRFGWLSLRFGWFSWGLAEVWGLRLSFVKYEAQHTLRPNCIYWHWNRKSVYKTNTCFAGMVYTSIICRELFLHIPFLNLDFPCYDYDFKQRLVKTWSFCSFQLSNWANEKRGRGCLGYVRGL